MQSILALAKGKNVSSSEKYQDCATRRTIYSFLGRKIDKPRVSFHVYDQPYNRNALKVFLVTRSISWRTVFKVDLSPEENSVTPTN